MQTRALAGAGEVILECVDAITGLDDALSIISATYELNTHRVLLRDAQLPAEFFELRTRFAGEFVQKLVNYQLTVACVFDERQAVQRALSRVCRRGQARSSVPIVHRRARSRGMARAAVMHP